VRFIPFAVAALTAALVSGCSLVAMDDNQDPAPIFDGALESIDGQPASSAVSLQIAASDGDQPSHYRIGLPGCTQGASSDDGRTFQSFEVLAPCTQEALEAFTRARTVVSGPTTLTLLSGEYAEIRSTRGVVRFSALSAGR